MSYSLTLFMLLCIILSILIFNYFDPYIDIITKNNKHRILLWYNKWDYYKDKYKRVYIELFKY